MKPLCFVLMPFGQKEDHLGRKIDFNKVYEEMIKPAIIQCDIQPLRADEELILGNIHKPMFERLVLCDYAIADLTSLNPNVFYELGLRHAIKPFSTIPISAFDSPLPFDVHSERTLGYQLDENGKLSNTEEDIQNLIRLIKACKNDRTIDSPVFQLLDGWKVSHSLTHEKTDVFREKVDYEKSVKDELWEARTDSAEAIDRVYDKIKPISDNSAGMVIDLFLSYRNVKAYDRMIDIFNEMDKPLKKLKMVKEQLGFAQNRIGEEIFTESENEKDADRKKELKKRAIAEKKKALKTLEDIIEEYGADPETNSLIGRVYKDLFIRYAESGNSILAESNLEKAIEAYKAGFDSDWRDAYPGVNLVTLLYINEEQELLKEYLPVVKFAISQKLKAKRIDYWDIATQGELAVLSGDLDLAKKYFVKAIEMIENNEFWMLESSLKNLRMINRNKAGNQDITPLIEELEEILETLN